MRNTHLSLLDIPDLDDRAFKPELGKVRLYDLGKGGSPPPAPDYTAAANATAAGQLEAARAATKANRINQYTPYGSLTYSQNPTGRIDYDAYNKAMQNYSTGSTTSTGGYTTVSRPGVGDEGPYGERVWDPNLQTSTQSSSYSSAPRPEDFMTYDQDSGWEQRVTLDPRAQAALDQQFELNRKYGETANIGFDKVRNLFENPQLDTSVLPDRAINVGQTAQQAIMSRLQPQLAQSEEALRTRLANQGIGLGSTAYGREQNMAGQRRNDLELQAALQGISLDQANRASALQEQAYLQDRPLNLINALRAGNQVNTPQFQQFAQQATTQGPNLLGAAQGQYGAQMDAYNADAASSAGQLGGLFSIGMGVAGLPTAGGGSLGGNFLKGLF